eukprot:223008_1
MFFTFRLYESSIIFDDDTTVDVVDMIFATPSKPPKLTSAFVPNAAPISNPEPLPNAGPFISSLFNDFIPFASIYHLHPMLYFLIPYYTCNCCNTCYWIESQCEDNKMIIIVMCCEC